MPGEGWFVINSAPKPGHAHPLGGVPMIPLQSTSIPIIQTHFVMPRSCYRPVKVELGAPHTCTGSSKSFWRRK